MKIQSNSGCPQLFIPRKDDARRLQMDAKFADDEKANWLAVEDWANNFPCGGTGHRYATVVVATSNPSYGSLHSSAVDADFICTGTNDDVVIQAAVDTATAIGRGFGSPGGSILLMEGQYNLSKGVVGSDCDLLGVSNGLDGFGTFISFPAAITNGYGLKDFNKVSNLSITVGVGTGVEVCNAISADGVTQWIEDCVINSAGSLASGSWAFDATSTGIYTQNWIENFPVGINVGPDTLQALIAHNYVNICGVGINVDGGSAHNIVESNVTQDCPKGVSMSSTCHDNAVTSNMIVGTT
ncbi:MAG TPA: hypothetical protein VNV87_04425, partial [Acidimicrobiales bacterium]|nr:hypothetical protein [Acidimicrobiales bacterium]